MKDEKIIYILAGYFSSVFESKSIDELIIFKLIQSLECFHREVLTGNYVDTFIFESQTYPKIIEAIKDVNDISFKESMTNRMKYLNEYSLKKRITLLIEYIGEDIYSMLNNGITKQQYATCVANTRNHYTHLGQPKTPYAKDILRLYKELNYIFILILCKYLEIDNLIEIAKRLLKFYGFD